MKKYVFVLFTLILLAANSCQQKIDIEKEKAAIIAVIEEETNAYFDRDFDRLAANYVQDETNIRIAAEKSGYVYGIGWEEIGSVIKGLIESEEPVESKEVKSNFKIKVYQESAWAVFDNEWYNNEGGFAGKGTHVVFLEKVKGEWKIASFFIVNTSTWEDEGGNDAEETEADEVESETEDTE
ncbi:MAG: hypothetical protein J7K53_09985 [Bacteroidales bacterium]|nr:hypothetical protein [Bacteroidales bacterium]